MAFDLSKLPFPVQFAFKASAPSLWSTVVFGAIACGVKNPFDLADIAFHLHHPELSGRAIRSNETGLIAEWNSYYAYIKKALSGASAPKTIPSSPPSDGGGSVKIYTRDDLIDAAIADLKLTYHLSLNEEAMYRSVFKDMLRDQGHTAGNIGRPMSPDKVQEWFSYTKLAYKFFTVLVNIPSWAIGSLVASIAVMMSAVSLVLMVIGFGFALNKAMNSVYRCYGCYGQAYRIVAWAYGDPVPTKSQTVLSNTSHPMYSEAPDRTRMDEAWREGQRVAGIGIERAIATTASRAGISIADATRILKAFMRLNGKTALAKQVMKNIAKEIEGKDPQVANAISYQARSNSWSYPN